MNRSIRTGAIGALLDEYERAIADLKQVLATIPDAMLTQVTDPHTPDEHCRSLQAILSHVVHAGFGYATSIHNLKGHGVSRPDKTAHESVNAYIDDLDRMFRFTEEVFDGLKDDELEEMDASLKILTGWGQTYDREQMMEHAIVHILRHRRQIERIKQRPGRA